MIQKSRELIFLILSLILLVGTGFLYVTQGHRHHKPVTGRPLRSKQLNAVSASTDEALTAFEAELEQAENNPSSETLTNLLKRFKELPDHSSKKENELRLAQLKETIEQIEAATNAVNQAERSRLLGDIEQAQEKVNQLTNPNDRTSLQERLTALAQSTVQSTPAPLPQIETTPAIVELPANSQPIIEEAPATSLVVDEASLP